MSARVIFRVVGGSSCSFLWSLDLAIVGMLCSRHQRLTHGTCGLLCDPAFVRRLSRKWCFAYLSKRILYRFAQLALVTFQREQVITALLDYLLCNAGLAAHSVN